MQAKKGKEKGTNQTIRELGVLYLDKYIIK